MRKALLLPFLLVAAGHGLDRNDVSLRAGLRGGVPQGLGGSGRVTAYLFNLEAGAKYGCFTNTVQMGMGLRMVIGERNEFFWRDPQGDPRLLRDGRFATPGARP